jgi:hypothetical protein
MKFNLFLLLSGELPEIVENYQGKIFRKDGILRGYSPPEGIVEEISTGKILHGGIITRIIYPKKKLSTGERSYPEKIST